MKVYVITAGEYSDYHICAVAVDPDKAELLRKLYSGPWSEKVEIEEYDTEENTKLIGQKHTSVWDIRITAKGEIRSVTERWHFGDDQYQNSFYFPYWENGGFYASVCHDSRDAAIKIATDTRAKMLAEKYGL